MEEVMDDVSYDDEAEELAQTSLIYKELRHIEESIGSNRELSRTYMKLLKLQCQPAYKRKNNRIKHRLSSLESIYNQLEEEYSLLNDEYEQLLERLYRMTDTEERKRLVFMCNMEFLHELQ